MAVGETRYCVIMATRPRGTLAWTTMLDHTYKQDGEHKVLGEHDQLLTLLPGYRKESGELAAVRQNVTACVEEELDLGRLASIHGRLWSQEGRKGYEAVVKLLLAMYKVDVDAKDDEVGYRS
ncbi:hypothetical protein MY5147_009944, partial [Beauveria neobassiana]